MSESKTKRHLSRLRRAHHHEVRGALNALRLQLTLLQRGRETGADDERLDRWISAAAREAEALERTVEELAALETLETSVRDATAQEVVSRVVSLLRPLASTQRIELAVDAEAPASFDAAGLARPLLRLAIRSLVAAEPGGSMTLRLTVVGVEVVPGVAGDADPADGERVESDLWTVQKIDSDRVLLRAPR